MKLELNTPIKNINLSKNISIFWKEKILAKFDERHERYSWFDRNDKFPEWNKLNSDGTTLGEFLTLIAKFYEKENGDFQYNGQTDINSSNYLSVQLLNILNKENIELTKILTDNYNYERKDYKDWNIMDFYNIYLDYLNLKNEKISEILNNKFIEKLKEYKRYGYRSVDDDINTYFRLLKVTPSDKINHNWFAKNLDFFCMIEDEEERKLVNQCKCLNYDSQKKIHNYIKDNFPNHVEEHAEYYPKFLESKVFSTKRFYQGSVDVNLFSLVNQYGLTNKDVHHLSNIATHCLTVIASPEFMNLIEENILITNIETKENKSSVTLNFSTDTAENLDRVEHILLAALQGVLEVSQKIHLQIADSYHGNEEVHTNMNAKFVHQYYMYHNLNNTLDTNLSKPKKPKI